MNSCHDISEGGLITAVTESCFGRMIGANLELENDVTMLVLMNQMDNLSYQ